MAKERVLDIFDVLRSIDNRNFSYYEKLTKEQKDELEKSMWMVMRWASCSNMDLQLQTINEYVNVHFNMLRKHPQLQHRLLQLAGAGSLKRKWVKPHAAPKKDKLREWIIEQYPTYSDDEIDLLIATNSKENFIDRAEQLGMDKKQIKEIFK